MKSEMTGRNKVIENWMLSALSDTEMIDRCDDLHISDIDSNWRDRDQWLDGALESFVSACAIDLPPENRTN